jgi:hypothetical protein
MESGGGGGASLSVRLVPSQMVVSLWIIKGVQPRGKGRLSNTRGWPHENNGADNSSKERVYNFLLFTKVFYRMITLNEGNNAKIEKIV